MTAPTTGLLELRTAQAFDVDDAGRVLAGSDESGSTQLVEVAPDGTRTALTALPGPCTGRYVPGERAVIVVHDTDGDENAQLSLLRLDPPPTTAPAGLADLEPLVHAPGLFHRLLDVRPGRIVYATNRRNRVDFDVVVRDLATGAEQVAHDAGGYVVAARLRPDDGAVAVALQGNRPMSHYLRLTEPGRPGRDLTDPDGVGRHDGLDWAADGRSLLVTTDRDRDFAGIARLDVDAGTWTWLLTDDAHDLAGWTSPDGRRLLVETLVDGESRLALHDADSGERLRAVPLPGAGTAAAGVTVGLRLPDPTWAPGGAAFALSFTAPAVPGDAYRVDAATGTPTRVLTGSPAPAGLTLVEPESFAVPTPDGEVVPCYLYRPVVDPGPLAGASVLYIHGGPESASVRAFVPVVQLLLAQGLTVLVPNVRGSTGYGKRWYSLDDVRLRLDSVADLAALHAALPSLGLDPARSALYGGSYGGYMVLAGLTFQPELWRAGVDVVGISSLVTFLENTSPYRRAAREREYGSLEHDRDFLRAASPLTHIDRIRAPLFVVHGANDPRVPLSEARQLQAAVRDRGLECELLVYADEGHGLARRANKLDAYPKAAAFLARHLAG